MSEGLFDETRILRFLFSLGIYPGKRAYRYLKLAVIYYAESKSPIGLYAKIAQKYDVSVASVEKTVRTAVASLDVEGTKRALGAPYKMTAVAFIAAAAELLAYDDAVTERLRTSERAD